MFKVIFWTTFLSLVTRTLGTRRSREADGNIDVSHDGGLITENHTARHTPNASSEASEENNHTFGPSSTETHVHRSAASGRRQIFLEDPLSRYLDAHGVRTGQPCSQNSKMKNVGCASRCHCSFGAQCYPKELHIEDSSETPLNVGICQLSMTVFVLVSMGIIVTVFSCVIGLRSYLRLKEVEELYFAVGSVSVNSQIDVDSLLVQQPSTSTDRCYKEAVQRAVSEGVPETQLHKHNISSQESAGLRNSTSTGASRATDEPEVYDRHKRVEDAVRKRMDGGPDGGQNVDDDCKSCVQ